MPDFHIIPLPEKLLTAKELLSGVICLNREMQQQAFLRCINTNIPTRRRGFIRLHLASLSTTVFYPDGKKIASLGFRRRRTKKQSNLTKNNLVDLLLGIRSFIKEKGLEDRAQAPQNTFEKRFGTPRIVRGMRYVLKERGFFKDRYLTPPGIAGLIKTVGQCVRCQDIKRSNLTELINTQGTLEESDLRLGNAMCRTVIVGLGLIIALTAFIIGAVTNKPSEIDLGGHASANQTDSGNATMGEQKNGKDNYFLIGMEHLISGLLSSTISLVKYGIKNLGDTRTTKKSDQDKLAVTNACCDAFSQINNDIVLIAAMNKLLFAAEHKLEVIRNRLNYHAFRHHHLSGGDMVLNIPALRSLMDRDLSNTTKKVIARIEKACSSYRQGSFFYGKSDTTFILGHTVSIKRVLRSCFSFVKQNNRTVKINFNGVTKEQLKEMESSFYTLHNKLHSMIVRLYPDAHGPDVEIGADWDDHKEMLIRMCRAAKAIGELLTHSLQKPRSRRRHRSGSEGEEESKGHEGSA